MMYPRLNLWLTPPGLSSIRLAQWCLALGSIAMMAWSIWIVWETSSLYSDIERYEKAVTHAEMLDRQFVARAQSEGIDFSDQRLKNLQEEVAFANQLWALQTFSWTQFLTDLEKAVPPSISMESIATNFKDGTIVLSGSAVSLEDLTALAKGLEGHKAFYNVEIASHKIKTPEKNTKKKNAFSKPYVVFSMKVTYHSG